MHTQSKPSHLITMRVLCTDAVLYSSNVLYMLSTSLNMVYPGALMLGFRVKDACNEAEQKETKSVFELHGQCYQTTNARLQKQPKTVNTFASVPPMHTQHPSQLLNDGYEATE